MTTLLKKTLLVALSCAFSLNASVAKETEEQIPIPTLKTKLGWIEEVKITEKKLRLHAKLSVSSDSSSIHAEEIREFAKNGQNWVTFTIVDRDGVTTVLTREVQRVTKIRQPGGSKQTRYVVTLHLCIGGKYIEEEFSLSDRSEFDQEVAIGRELLAGEFIIDPALTFTVKPECQKK